MSYYPPKKLLLEILLVVFVIKSTLKTGYHSQPGVASIVWGAGESNSVYPVYFRLLKKNWISLNLFHRGDRNRSRHSIFVVDPKHIVSLDHIIQAGVETKLSIAIAYYL